MLGRQREAHSSGARAARTSELASSVFLAKLLELCPAEHPVGDGRDLFGLLPRALELHQLTGERAALGILVGGHLEREAIDERETQHERAWLTRNGAAPPERPIRDVQREALRRGGGNRK